MKKNLLLTILILISSCSYTENKIHKTLGSLDGCEGKILEKDDAKSCVSRIFAFDPFQLEFFNSHTLNVASNYSDGQSFVEYYGNDVVGKLEIKSTVSHVKKQDIETDKYRICKYINQTITKSKISIKLKNKVCRIESEERQQCNVINQMFNKTCNEHVWKMYQ